MDSRGAETGGYTMMDAHRLYEGRGFDAQFAARGNGEIKCFSCGGSNDARRYGLESLRRIEGASDPGDMCMVSALVCPACGVRGTATFCYGPGCPPEDAAVLRRLEDARAASPQIPDTSDVGGTFHDTGWLRGPDDR